MDLSDLQELVAHALANGATQTSRYLTEWQISGDCQSPKERTLHARPPRSETSKEVVIKPGSPHSLELRMTVRCRKCDPCRKQRQTLWMGRALGEMRQCNRTWLCTFTLAADHHYLFGIRAEQKYRRKGVLWSDMTLKEQLVARHETIQGELTKWLKRLRKAGHSLRYLLVMEAHKSGLPHYHMLVHEVGDPIRKTDLKKCGWDYGFTHFKLADLGHAHYVAKYLSKSTAARVRASVRYGNPPSRDMSSPKELERDNARPPRDEALASSTGTDLMCAHALDLSYFPELQQE